MLWYFTEVYTQKTITKPIFGESTREKRGFEDDDDEEFDASLTVVGEKSAEWIVKNF